ncbi:MAG: folate family ECF transporter S component [Bacillota bacterium]
MTDNSTKKLVYMAFLTSLSIVLTRIFSIRIPLFGVEGVRIGFGGLPIIFTGIIFGPVAGGIVGAISDLVGYFINPMGAYMPHFTITAFLTGFIPAVLFHYIFNGKYNFWILLTSIAAGQTITSILLVPFFIHILFGAPFIPLLIPRLISGPIHMVLYAYLIKVIASRDFIKIPKRV